MEDITPWISNNNPSESENQLGVVHGPFKDPFTLVIKMNTKGAVLILRGAEEVHEYQCHEPTNFGDTTFLIMAPCDANYSYKVMGNAAVRHIGSLELSLPKGRLSSSQGPPKMASQSASKVQKASKFKEFFDERPVWPSTSEKASRDMLYKISKQLTSEQKKQILDLNTKALSALRELREAIEGNTEDTNTRSSPDSSQTIKGGAPLLEHGGLPLDTSGEASRSHVIPAAEPWKRYEEAYGKFWNQDRAVPGKEVIMSRHPHKGPKLEYRPSSILRGLMEDAYGNHAPEIHEMYDEPHEGHGPAYTRILKNAFVTFDSSVLVTSDRDEVQLDNGDFVERVIYKQINYKKSNAPLQSPRVIRDV